MLIGSLGLAGVLGSVVTPQRVAAVPIITAACISQSNFDANTFHLAANNERVAQAFTSALTGKLTVLEVIVKTNADDTRGTFIAQIFQASGSNGVPSGDPLASKKIDSRNVAPDESVLTFKFRKRKAAKLVAGEHDAFVLRRQGLEGYQVGGRISDECAFEALRSFGGAFSDIAGAPSDFVFRAFVNF